MRPLTEAEPQLPGIPAPPDFARCLRCGRPLRSERSRQLGLGPACAGVIGLNVRLMPAAVLQAVRESMRPRDG